MTIHFTRSVRALRLDSFRASRIGLVLAILIMAALILWFFLAKVTMFESSNSLQGTSEGKIMAVFPKESVAKIHPGQSATLRISESPGQPAVSIPLFVYSLDQGGEEVLFVPLSSEIPAQLFEGNTPGRIEVEVEYIHPVELVLRSSGKYFAQREIPLSPQKNNNQGSQ